MCWAIKYKNSINIVIMKKLLIKILVIACFLSCIFYSRSFAADFIIPNTGSDPIVIDIANLNVTSGIDVTVGSFNTQPRPYIDENIKELVIFPLAGDSSEKVIQLSAGNSVITKTISFRSAPPGNIQSSSLPDIQTARAGNTVTKISDGRVILTGGSKTLSTMALSSIEIYNPETGRTEFLNALDSTKKAILARSRSHHTATYIGRSNQPIGEITGPVEQILLVGGFTKDGSLDNTIEIVEIKVGSNEAVSTLLQGKNTSLKKARLFHTASLLSDGRVLIIGGLGKLNSSMIGALNSVEIFDPVTKKVLPSTITLNTARLLHTATILQNSDILIVGGFTNEKASDFKFGPATETAELIDVATLTTKSVGSLVNLEGIGGHAAALLTNGYVLISGGSTDFFSGQDEDGFRGLTKGTLQVYNPANETFSLVNDSEGNKLNLKTTRFLHSTVLLPNGDITFIGGLNIKPGINTDIAINTPVSEIEIIRPDLSVSSPIILKAEYKSIFENFTGRILPSAILVTPKNKTEGFLTTDFSNNFVNSAVYITGGFTNGSGALPTASSELLQIVLNEAIEGRNVELSPKAVVKGGFLDQFIAQISEFTKLPSVTSNPQTINLSTSNNFMANVIFSSTNNNSVLLKAESLDPNESIVVSPVLFQTGDTVSITRKDASVNGEFELNVLPANADEEFIQARLKVNVSDSSKPFIYTIPEGGISLSADEGFNSAMIQLKILSGDGLSEFTTVPLTTSITASVADPSIINLGNSGVSSIVGTLATEFSVHAIKPGATTLNFSTTFPDVLSVSIPVQVSGTPSFSDVPLDTTIINSLASNKIELSDITKLNPTLISLNDVRISSNSSLFPTYIPINLISSLDLTVKKGLFTISSIFSADAQTSVPRTLTTSLENKFKSSTFEGVSVIGGIVSENENLNPIVIFATTDGLRILQYDSLIDRNISNNPQILNNTSNVNDLKLIELDGSIKIILITGDSLQILDAITGDLESAFRLSGIGKEIEFVTIGNQLGCVVSVGVNGADLVHPLTGGGTRVVNFQLGGITERIDVVNELDGKTGPFIIAFDEINTISATNLVDVDTSINSVLTDGSMITDIAYAGKFKVNEKLTDVLVAASDRQLLLFDLNNRSLINPRNDLKLKTKINDLLVKDGIVYLALGKQGIEAVTVDSLINSTSDADVRSFTKNQLKVIKSNGSEVIKTKKINSVILADSTPFLLSSGNGNDLTVIKISP